MSLQPVIAFNKTPASLGDYFNHDPIMDQQKLSVFGKDTIRPGETSEVFNFYITHNHDDKIENVSFYLSSPNPESNAMILSSNSENYSIISGVNDKLYIKLDDRIFFYDITLTSGNKSASQICDEINFTINELIAIPESGKIKLISPSSGINSKIYINSSSTSASILGFPYDDINPIATGSIIGWGTLGNGAYGKCIGKTLSYDIIITNTNNTIRASLNFSSYVNITIPEGTYYNGAELEDALKIAFENAGFDTTSDIEINVESNKIVLKSLLKGDASSIRIRKGLINDASVTLGLDEPIETYSDYANTSALEDLNEIASWGNNNAGLYIGDSTSWVKFKTGSGNSPSNAIFLYWGDGPTPDSIKPFKSFSNIEGEIQTQLKLEVPNNVSKTGYRELSLVVEFTYL